MTEPVDLDIRLGSTRLGNKANARLAWSVGINKSFIESLDEDQRRIKLEQQNGELAIKIGSEGVLASVNTRGNFAYATSLGQNHLMGLSVPEQEITTQRLKGQYLPDLKIIEVIGELPGSMVSTFVDIKAAKAQADPAVHFPATHFMEDIKEELLAQTKDLDSVEGARAWFNNRVKMGANTDYYERAQLTPALAQVLLEHNTNNRPIRRAKLAQYASDITNDRWQFNGETIIISKEGLVNNGQHRCLAVIETGKAIDVAFVFGVDRASRTTVDTGASRGPQDQLSADGYAQPTTMAACARFILAYENSGGHNFINLNRVTSAQVYERAVSDAGVEKSSLYPYTHNTKAKRLTPPSVMAFCHYEFSKVDAQQGVDFLEQVISGADLSSTSAAYVTREKLLSMDSILREHKIEVLFRGFKAFRKNKPITSRMVRVRNELPQL